MEKCNEMKCEECGNEIDSSKEGHGHSVSPPCGQYTFEVNPDVIKFIKERPDATAKQLLDGWIAKILKEES